ncbi:Cytochrome P450 superfamily protein, partial [Prunus dulcis]
MYAWLSKSKNKKRLPPGPRGFPLFGNLHMLGEFPHRYLHRLAQKHGDVMYLLLGLAPVVVASSPQAAEPFLKTHDLVFASRPPLQAAEHISYGQRNLSFGAYGSYWRTIHKINSFKPMRKEELALLTKFIQEAARDRVTVDLSGKVASLAADMSCLMGMHLAATPNFGDFIPFIAPLDLQGLTKRMKGVSKVFDAFFEKIIDEHIQSTDQERTKDFVDVMLGFMGSEESEYRLERSNIKAIILDKLAGAMDTKVTAIEWTVSELIKHPRVMKKVQKELENVVGMEREVEESYLEKLEHLDMVVKETMRLHPVAPLLLPHAAIEDCNRSSYPKGSTVAILIFGDVTFNLFHLGLAGEVARNAIRDYYGPACGGTTWFIVLIGIFQFLGLSIYWQFLLIAFSSNDIDNNIEDNSTKPLLSSQNSVATTVDLRCQLPNEGVQNADVSGDCEKNEDEDDFSFAPDGSPISTDDIFQIGQIRPMFSIFNQDLLFSDADDDEASRAKGAAASSSYLRLPLKKLFFEERDTPTSGNVVLQLRRWTRVVIYEINPLLSLIINTFYNKKEIFSVSSLVMPLIFDERLAAQRKEKEMATTELGFKKPLSKEEKIVNKKERLAAIGNSPGLKCSIHDTALYLTIVMEFRNQLFD